MQQVINLIHIVYDLRTVINVAKKKKCLRILTKKGGPSSNRISFKRVNLTHYRGTCVLPKLRKKGQISWFKGTWACVFSLDLTLTDWDRCRLGCRPPLAV